MTKEPRQSPSLPAASVQAKRLTSHQTERIDRIFAVLSAFYGARFADLWRGCDLEVVKRVWATELAELSSEEIAHGLAACKTRDWPPTLPEFLKACRPPLDYERAYWEAVEQMRRRRQDGGDVWSRPAIYWAAAELGEDLLAFAYNAIQRRWQASLDNAVEAVRSGRLPAQVPPRREPLPTPGQRTLTREEVVSRLAEIRERLHAARRQSAMDVGKHQEPTEPAAGQG